MLGICMVASEVAPFAKTGGLADMVAGLSKYLHTQGHDVRLFLPFYDVISLQGHSFYPVEFAQNVVVPFEGYSLSFSLLTSRFPGTDLEVYFIHCPALYHRGSIYTNDWDEYLRFVFLSRAAIESCQRMGWSPHIFHCHDWHTALLPLYLLGTYHWDSLFARSKTVLTIHNIGYQGIFGKEVAWKIGLSDYLYRFPKEDLERGVVNFLKIGLIYSDALTAVSATYAKEILTPEGGAGLDSILRMRQNHLFGIVNGVDYGTWNPARDPYLPYPYSLESRKKKKENKRAVLARFGLKDGDVPVFGIVSRLTYQKGFDLLFGSLFWLLTQYDVRLLVLGSGERRYEDFFHMAKVYFPRKVMFHCGYSEELAHLIQGASDMLLMPSRYEPCGLTQIYALKYGTIPIVRKTGGLADTVRHWTAEKEDGTGFVFEHFDTQALRWAIEYALGTYAHKPSWDKLMANAMAEDFSWEKQGKLYEKLYSQVAS